MQAGGAIGLVGHAFWDASLHELAEHYEGYRISQGGKSREVYDKLENALTNAPKRRGRMPAK